MREKGYLKAMDGGNLVLDCLFNCFCGWQEQQSPIYYSHTGGKPYPITMCQQAQTQTYFKVYNK